MTSKMMVQHITSGLTFLTGFIFCLLKIFGVVLVVNESDINTLIFALGSFIAICIELIPFIIKTIKDKNLLRITVIVSDVVRAIDELEESLTSSEKKNKAMSIIITECEKHNLKIELEDIDRLIEAAVKLRNKVLK